MNILIKIRNKIKKIFLSEYSACPASEGKGERYGLKLVNEWMKIRCF